MAEKKHDMPHFTEQDRPEKVKDIYRALKRDRPDMPAEMKARIAARQGKPGKQKQGPPYKAPIHNTYSEKDAKELIHGGLADYKPDRFYSKDQLRKGIKVELEHVDDKARAKEIAKDHLEEQRREGEGPSKQDYYDKLLKMEGESHSPTGKAKHAQDDQEQQEPGPEANSTLDVVSPDLPLSKIEQALESYLIEAQKLSEEVMDPDSGEFIGTPEQQERLNKLDSVTEGLKKIIRQRKHNIKDTLTDSQMVAMKMQSLLTPSTKVGESSRKVSPHGKEVVFPETNTVTAGETARKLKGPMNMLAAMTTNGAAGRNTGRSPDHQPLSNPSYTGPGDIASHPAQAPEKVATAQNGEKKEGSMDVYDKRINASLNRKSSLVDPREIKVAFFFEGLADSLEKQGYYVTNPEAFFTGTYEALREHFEGDAKLASGVYPGFVVNACQAFTDRMTKTANGFANLTPVNPLDPNAAQQAQENALGVSPARQEKRQDIIDSLLPHAETISLDPDGKIKLKMPSPEAQGVMDPQLMQQQQMAEMEGRQGAQQAGAQPVESGQENPAAAQLMGGEGAEVDGGDPQGLAQNAESPMTGGGGSAEEALLQQLLSPKNAFALVGSLKD